MKALSLRPHWAHAVIHMGKSIENRKWATRYRGPLLIHAGRHLTTAEYEYYCHWAMRHGLPEPDRAGIKSGGLIGRVQLVDIVSKSTSPFFLGPLGWVLADPKPMRFKPLIGQQRLFNINKT